MKNTCIFPTFEIAYLNAYLLFLMITASKDHNVNRAQNVAFREQNYAAVETRSVAEEINFISLAAATGRNK